MKAQQQQAQKRRIFIGDIQGCREELEALLERVGFDPSGDDLEPVGDLVNRGPDSLGVLSLLRSLNAGGVLGNHDLHLLACAGQTRRLRSGDTLDAVLADENREELLAWLQARPFLRVWDDLFLVHAGLNPVWDDPVAALRGEDPLAPGDNARFAVRTRYCDSEGLTPKRDYPSPGDPFRPWFDWYRPERFADRGVVFGHWARRGLVRGPSLCGLDTGCVWGGSLSAWIPEQDRLVSVPARRMHARPKNS